MKIGFVFECNDDGPDEKVYRTLIKKLIAAGEIGDVEVDSAGLGNLPKVKDGCGKAAAAFFRTGCERVFVCWDLWPSHGEEAPVCTDQRAELVAALRAAEVDLDKVHFVCIRRELEAWLVADGDAIKAQWNPNRGRAPSIPHEKDPDNHTHPKNRLRHLYKKTLKQGDYEGHIHAVKIANHIDLRRLSKSQSFCHFVCRLRRVSPGTSTTICPCPPDA